MFRKLVGASTLLAFLCVALTVQVVGCGTFLYPERKGQTGGRIDTGVAILDGLGLLLFVIPGIIAFAVDFNNGTIYLPGTLGTSLDPNEMKEIRFDPKHTSMASIEKIIEKETGYEVKLDQYNMEISKLKSIDEMMTRFAEVMPEKQNVRVNLLSTY